MKKLPAAPVSVPVGCALRQPNVALRYLADGSYGLWLVHLLGTLGRLRLLEAEIRQG